MIFLLAVIYLAICTIAVLTLGFVLAVVLSALDISERGRNRAAVLFGYLINLVVIGAALAYWNPLGITFN